jgi:hypothetical protein
LGNGCTNMFIHYIIKAETSNHGVELPCTQLKVSSTKLLLCSHVYSSITQWWSI